jgi:hypothetical protein
MAEAVKPGRFAIVLVLVFLFMFMGMLPSPMLSAIGVVTEEHRGMMGVLRQICVNTSKDQQAVNLCFFAERPAAP